MYSMAPLNIPSHRNCTNCGGCCGIVPVTHDDIQRIREYVEKHEYARKTACEAHRPFICRFLDESQKMCSIYAVRPIVCRLFGVTEGMQCPNGNSAAIDGYKYLTEEPVSFMNSWPWRTEYG